MEMSLTIESEALVFWVSMVVGVGLFLLYDLFRIFRRVVPHGIVWISVEDFLYWLIFAAVLFLLLYICNEGMFRGYVMLALMLGMLLYLFVFSKYVIRINVYLLKKVFKVLGCVWKLLWKIFGVFWKPLTQCGRKILYFPSKWLKNLWKAVKMSIGKR